MFVIADRLRAVCRAAALIAASALAACGGGGGGGSAATAEIPVQIGLTATAVNGHAIDLRWSALSVTRYDVHVNGVFFASSYPSSPSSGAEVARVGALAASTHYCFIVYAVYFPVGIASRSNEACVSTFADAAPSMPTALTAAATTPARIELTWTASTDDWGVVQYRVARNGAAFDTAPAPAYADASPDPATTYCYTVTAIDTGGNASPPSAQACATTPADLQPPGAPAFLSAAAQDKTVALTWAAAIDNGAVARYRIVRDGTPLADVAAVAGVDPVTTKDTGLTASTQYCYQVIAVDRAGNASPPSGVACTTTSWTLALLVPAPAARDLVGDLNAAAVDAAGRLHIAYSFTPWNAAANAPGATELYYLTNATGAWSGSAIHTPIQAAPAIAVGASAVHFAYKDTFVEYAQLAAGLTTERVANDMPRDVAVALDGGGTPHVAYGATNVRHAVRNGGIWTISDVSAVVPFELSFALDRNGKAHIAFRDSIATTLYHATDTSGAWTVETVRSGAAGSFFFPRIGIGPSGVVHLAYHDQTAAALTHATNSSGTWVHTPIDPATGGGPGIALFVDGTGAVHVSYADQAIWRVKYAHNRAGTWRTFDIDGAGAGGGGNTTSIAVDPAGRVYIVYSNGGLKLATGQ